MNQRRCTSTCRLRVASSVAWLVLCLALSACFPDRLEGKACDIGRPCVRQGDVCVDDVCVPADEIPAGADAGVPDAGMADAGMADAGMADAGMADAEMADGGGRE